VGPIISFSGKGASVDGVGEGVMGMGVGIGFVPQPLTKARMRRTTNRNTLVDFFIVIFKSGFPTVCVSCGGAGLNNVHRPVYTKSKNNVYKSPRLPDVSCTLC
jgi:hypothetical protein